MIPLKLHISGSAALPAAFVAAMTRIFLDLALDGGPIHNGIWVAALFTALPIMPYLLCLDAIRTKGCAVAPVRFMLLSVTVLDAAQVQSSVIRASGYLTLDHVSPVSLALPLAVGLLWCVWRGGEAMGYAALLWSRLFPALLLLVVLLQLRHYEPRWLFPLLGNGWREIIRGGVRASGWVIPATAVMFTADVAADDPGHQHSVVWISMAPVAAALLLALRLMMAPTGKYDLPWFTRLDALLTNGRAPLYLQLPMIVAFFIGNLHLLACEYFSASALVQRLNPTMDGRLCAALVVTLCTVLSLSGMTRQLVDGVAPWLFIAAAMLTALTAFFIAPPSGGNISCES